MAGRLSQFLPLRRPFRWPCPARVPRPGV